VIRSCVNSTEKLVVGQFDNRGRSPNGTSAQSGALVR
jgi:hypothetical protein